MKLKNFQTFIFDLDGTFWNFPLLMEGAKEVYDALKNLNKKIIFVSNFTYLDRDGILKIFRKNGIDIKKEQIVTSGYVAAKVLQGKKVFVLGDGLKNELIKDKVQVSEKEAEAVVVGHDTKFNYWKASKALNFLLNGAKLYTTAMGKIWIFEGKNVPGTGLILKGLEFCSGKKAIMLGKPSKFMMNEIKKVVEGKAIYFGDEIDADVKFAKRAKFFTVFVRSGVDAKAKKVNADLILNSVKDLLKYL